jgi:hypothetical protein
MIRIEKEDGRLVPLPPGDPKLKVAPIPERDVASVDRVKASLMGPEQGLVGDPSFQSPYELRLLAIERRLDALEALAPVAVVAVSGGSRVKPASVEAGMAYPYEAPEDKPWIAAGVSKATWYRQQKKKGAGGG